MFRNVAELVELAESKGEKISDMIQQEMKYTVKSKETLNRPMHQNLAVMEEAVERGLDGIRPHSGLTILCDGRIEAMVNIVQTMPVASHETAQGGLAATPTGEELNEKYFRLQRIKNE